MGEVDERIARLRQLLDRADADAESLTHTLSMLRQLRAEMDLVAAD